MQVNYKIRSFDAEHGQVIVEFEDLAPMAIDLVIDEHGCIPEGQALDGAIRQFLPVWVIERRQKLASGIKNVDSVIGLIEPFPPAPPPTAEELASDARANRDFLLSQSDWTQVSDVALTEDQKQAWATYRQALRDVPEQPGFPSNINWPEAP